MIAQATATELRPIFRAMGLPTPEREYRFAPPRLWRIDYAWVEARLALEIEGGVWQGHRTQCPVCGRYQRGRHNSSAGFMKDLEKYNALALAGWRLLRVTPDMLKSGEAFTLVKQALGH